MKIVSGINFLKPLLPKKLFIIKQNELSATVNGLFQQPISDHLLQPTH